MGIAFTKKEKGYFDFLLEMGFIINQNLSDKNNLQYERILEGDSQFVHIGKNEFVGSWRGKQIKTFKFFLNICTSRIGPIEECMIPQQIDCYHTDDEKKIILEKYRILIKESLEHFEKHDHITGSMNEYVYNNYLCIAKEAGFIPKTMDELNQYAIKLKEEKKNKFKDYIYVISSLMITYLISNTNIKVIYLRRNDNRLLDLLVLLNPYPKKPLIGFCPTTCAKSFLDGFTNDLFYENRDYLDNYFKSINRNNDK